MSTLTDRALLAQDGIGWKQGGAECPICSEVLDLARVVVALAREVERLQARPSQPPTADEVECCASGSCEVCKR